MMRDELLLRSIFLCLNFSWILLVHSFKKTFLPSCIFIDFVCDLNERYQQLVADVFVHSQSVV